MADDDTYFILTEALGDFASRQRSQAENDDNASTHIKLAEAAEALLDRVEEALSGPGTIEGIVAASIEQQSVWDNALRHPGMEGY